MNALNRFPTPVDTMETGERSTVWKPPKSRAVLGRTEEENAGNRVLERRRQCCWCPDSPRTVQERSEVGFDMKRRMTAGDAAAVQPDVRAGTGWLSGNSVGRLDGMRGISSLYSL